MEEPANPLLLGVIPILGMGGWGKAARNAAYKRQIEDIERGLRQLKRGANSDAQTRHRHIELLEKSRDRAKKRNEVENILHDDRVLALNALLYPGRRGTASELESVA